MKIVTAFDDHAHASSALHNRSTFFAQCRLLAVILTMRIYGHSGQSTVDL